MWEDTVYFKIGFCVICEMYGVSYEHGKLRKTIFPVFEFNFSGEGY